MTHRRSGVLQLAAFAALLALAHPLTLTAGNGDYDLDNDIDWDDFANWALCMTGSNGGPLNPDLDACSVFDFDGDFDVDLVDFGAFQAAFQKPPAAACQRYNGNSRLYAGATKYVPTNSNHGAAIGGTAKITQPFHKMKLCGEPAGLKKTAQSSVVFGVTEDDIIFGQYIWWFQIGYARRRFEHPHGPYLPGVMFDGLFAESKNRGFYNLAVSNYAPPHRGTKTTRVACGTPPLRVTIPTPLGYRHLMMESKYFGHTGPIGAWGDNSLDGISRWAPRRMT